MGYPWDAMYIADNSDFRQLLLQGLQAKMRSAGSRKGAGLARYRVSEALSNSSLFSVIIWETFRRNVEGKSRWHHETPPEGTGTNVPVLVLQKRRGRIHFMEVLYAGH